MSKDSAHSTRSKQPAEQPGDVSGALTDQERIRQLVVLVDRQKKRIIELEQAIRANAVANAQAAQALIDQRKRRIDEAMHRFAQRENSFK